MTKDTTNQIQTLHHPTWCPGCGNFGIIASIKKTIKNLNTPLKDIVMVYDVGCSGNMNDFLHLNNFHTLHGRAIPVAEGIKLANHKLKVMVVIGDGGCYGEGVQHLIASARGNHDITVIVHNNELYALTTGQASPTTEHLHPTKTTPDGVIEIAFNPILQMLASGASYVARGYAGNLPQLTKLIEQAVNHTGFSLVDVIQPCLTFNSYHDFSFFSDKVYDLGTTQHDSASLKQALQKSYEHGHKIPTGLFYSCSRPAYHQSVKLLKTNPLIDHSYMPSLKQLFSLHV